MKNWKEKRARKEEMKRLTLRIEVQALWLWPAAIDEGLEKMSTGRRGDKRAKLATVIDQINFRTSDAGSQFRYRQVGRDSQPPSTPNTLSNT